MGLKDEYEDQVEEVQESVETHFSYRQALDFKKFLDNILPFILMLVTFIVLFEFVLPVNAAVERWITWANWTVIGYFGLRLVVSYKLAATKESFVRNHWLDMLLVVPAFSLIREIKFVKLAEETGIEARGVSLVTPAFIESTGMAAKVTRIVRVLKRSV